MNKHHASTPVSRIRLEEFKHCEVDLILSSKSLEVNLLTAFIDLEILLELTRICQWCADHSEIVSLYIKAKDNIFIQGISSDFIKNCTEIHFKNFYDSLRAFSHSLMSLPQTTIVDLGLGAQDYGVELALAADIRLGQPKAIFNFKYLSQGLTPTGGLFSFLLPMINRNLLRTLLLTEIPFNIETLSDLGGDVITHINAYQLMEKIKYQAPVARLQAKLGLLGPENVPGTTYWTFEKQIFNVVRMAQDYKKNDGDEFTSIKCFKEKIRNLETQ